MSDIKHAYNNWAAQYDTNKNHTRDVEAIALKKTLQSLEFQNCLEIGCGTGKNTQFLVNKAQRITSVDFSEEMLAVARQKITQPQVTFLQTDIIQPWHFAQSGYDLVTFSLVLEHIENLDAIFEKVSQVIQPGGYVYIGELHPFKQYNGSKARFETSEGTQVLTCYTHHISDFTQLAKKHRFALVEVNEHFDEDDRSAIPRILSLLLRGMI